MTTATVTQDGTIAIPRALCERLGVRPGDSVQLELDGQQLLVQRDPVRRRVTYDDLEALVGSVDIGMSTDEFLDELRGPRGRLWAPARRPD